MSGLRHCRKCQALILESDERCPMCDTRQTKGNGFGNLPSKIIKAGIWATFGLAALAAVFYFGIALYFELVFSPPTAEEYTYYASLFETDEPELIFVFGEYVDVNAQRLNLQGKGITHIDRNIVYLQNLEFLDLRDNLLVDTTVLKQLPNLQRVLLTGNMIDDLNDLNLPTYVWIGNEWIGTYVEELDLRDTGLTQIGIQDIHYLSLLRYLNIADNNLRNLNFLIDLPNLVRFYGWKNGISDLQPLSYLHYLESINLWDNDISDVTALSELPNLRRVILENNDITDISPLVSNSNIGVIDVGHNRLGGLPDLTDAVHITHLGIHVNQITDISELAHLTNLHVLRAGSNGISDLTPLENLTNLVQLSLNHNAVYDISPLENLENLTHLWLESNEIEDVTPLRNLTNLRHLILNRNRIADVEPLANLVNLELLSLRFGFTDMLETPDNEIENCEVLAELGDDVVRGC